jgi:hypothetical protein
MRYNLQARLFPALITSPPIVVLGKIIFTTFENNIKESAFLPATAQVSLYLALFSLLVQLNRIVSVEISQKYLAKSELHTCPVSWLLLLNAVMDQTKKYKIRNKIKEMFGIKLLSRSKERINELKARELIFSAIAKMQTLLQGHKILLQHKIEYAFARNLIGGAAVAVILSFGLLIFGCFTDTGWIIKASIIMALVYLLPVVCSKYIIKWYGSRYTKVLFEKFLGL